MEEFIKYCKIEEGKKVDGILSDDDLIDFETLKKYAKEYDVKLNLPVVSGN